MKSKKGYEIVQIFYYFFKKISVNFVEVQILNLALFN